MKIVMVVWCKSDSNQFEKHIPLRFIGLRNKLLGYSNDINLLFIEGYHLIDEEYKGALKDLGYKIHDTSAIYRELSEKYKILYQFGDYEQKCFLRWLVISKYFSKDKILHFDGDVVFNECPQTLSEKLKNKTFVLQGCPALTVVSNTDWYSIFEENLNLFTQNIQKYSETAWRSKPDWKHAEFTWTGMRDRRIISSDQDLFRHLLYNKIICQNTPHEICNEMENYIFFENPLHLEAYNTNQLPFVYRRIDGIDFINDKMIAVWHMQSAFYEYCANFIFRKKYLRFYGHHKLRYQDKDMESILRDIVTKIFRIECLSRLDVYEYFFKEKDFKELFSASNWYRQGVFLDTY